MKKQSFIMFIVLISSMYIPSVHADLKGFLKRGAEHCTSGKKLLGSVEGHCDQPDNADPEKNSCVLGNYLWCKENCGHKMDMDKICKVASKLNIRNGLPNSVSYNVVGSDGRSEYELLSPVGGAIAQGSSQDVQPKKDIRSENITSLNVNGISQGLMNREVSCKGLALGKDYTITFKEGSGLSIECVAAEN